MYASELLSALIPCLSPGDTGRTALKRMTDFHVRHLPVVEDERFMGLVSEEDILANDWNDPLNRYDFSRQPPLVHASDHLFDVFRLMGNLRLTVVPVVDSEYKYQGLITQENLMTEFAGMASLEEHGGILVLEMGKHDYSLAHIARIAEGEDAIILSSFVTSNPESTGVELTIKVNRRDIRSLVSAFERHDYQVKGSFVEDNYNAHLQEHYDSLMHYLNLG